MALSFKHFRFRGIVLLLLCQESVYIVGEGGCIGNNSSYSDCRYLSGTNFSVPHYLLNHYTKYGFLRNPLSSMGPTLTSLLTCVVVLYTYTDRFGSLKLYYSLCNRVLSLSSDIRPILALDCTLSLPNWSTVLTYLFRNYRYAYSTSSTFFDSIKSIPPATITGFLNNLTDVTSHSIKQNENVSSIDHISDEQAVNRFRDLLLEALEVRLTDTNDSEAYLLSGGLDSPTVAASLHPGVNLLTQ